MIQQFHLPMDPKNWSDISNRSKIWTIEDKSPMAEVEKISSGINLYSIG